MDAQKAGICKRKALMLRIVVFDIRLHITVRWCDGPRHVDVTFQSIELRNIVAFVTNLYRVWQLYCTQFRASLRNSLSATLVVVLPCDAWVKGQDQVASGITEPLRTLLAVDLIENAAIWVLP